MTLPPPTVSNLEYSTWLKVANVVARAGETLGLPLGYLDADSICAAARRQTGLTEWGESDFLEPMQYIVQAVAERPEFTPLARVLLRQSWIMAVSHRLHIEEWLKKHPEVREAKVERPIFVLGFPRTGTTLLQNLLASQEGRRGLPMWEVTTPVPMHEDRELDRELRRRTGRRILQAAYTASPEMAAVHYIDVDTLEECWPLFGPAFTVMNWELQSGLSKYGDWLVQRDMTGPYAEYKRYLQVAQERWPVEHLVLKCPEHLWFIDALLAVFPDACIVWTHRDPYDTVASYCSLMSLQWRNLFGKIDRPAIGAFMQERLLVGIDRAMEARTRLDPSRFYDVRFEELVADPARVVRDLSHHFSLPLSADHSERVNTYLSKKRADERGQHKYDGRVYGLDKATLHAKYAHYIESFGIATR